MSASTCKIDLKKHPCSRPLNQNQMMTKMVTFLGTWVNMAALLWMRKLKYRDGRLTNGLKRKGLDVTKLYWMIYFR